MREVSGQAEKNAEWRAPQEAAAEKGSGDFAAVWQGYDALRQAKGHRLPDSANTEFRKHLAAIEKILHNADPEKKMPWQSGR